MLQTVLVMVRYYQEVARHLAHAHGIPYPQQLEIIVLERLEKLQPAPSS